MSLPKSYESSISEYGAADRQQKSLRSGAQPLKKQKHQPSNAVSFQRSCII